MPNFLKTVLVSSFMFIFSLTVSDCDNQPATPSEDQPARPSADFDLQPFISMAKGDVCSNRRNELYLIDKALVFWDRAGTCADASYSQTLYGKSTDDIKCRYNDSIAGPVEICNDSTYYDMFQTMKENIDAANLGLGTGHSVENMPL